jgi:putative transposase
VSTDSDRPHIHYYADALKPWIARRDRLPAFLIRRDPRDISRIKVLEPEDQHYLEIPYRTLSHPAVTLWEQRQALARLRQLGREQGGRGGVVPHDRPTDHAQGASRC